MSLHYLVKCTTFSSDWTHWRYVAFLQTLVALKKAGCALALVGLKNNCDVWQMKSQASNVTANLKSDHLLHRYMLPVFSPLINCIVHHALMKFSPCCNKTLPQLICIADWYSIRVKRLKIMQKICVFYKVVRWHFSGMVGKAVTVCFLLRWYK